MKLKKTLIKDYFKNISLNKKYFYLITTITILTLSIYISLLNTPYNFKNTIEKYYQDTLISDIKISSNIGFNKEDETLLKSIDEINGIMFSKTLDATVNINNKNYNIKVNSISENRDKKSINYINRLILTNGKYPTTINEGLVEENFLKEQNLSLGDLITLENLNKNSLKAKKIKIVGTVKSSYYSVFEKESVNKNDKTNDYYVYLEERNFYSENYNEIFLTLKDSSKKDIFNKSYEKYINENKDKINKLLSSVIKEKYQNKVSLLNNDISFIKDELNRLYNLDLPQDSLNESIKQLSDQIEEKNEELSNLTENNFSILSKNETSGFIKYKLEIENMKVISEKLSILSLILGIIINSFIMLKLIINNKKQINILYSIGYSKIHISFKYILFIFLACIIGSLLSLFISFLMTNIIAIFYKSIYQIPSFITSYQSNYVAFSFLFTTLLNLLIVILILCFVFKKNFINLISKKINTLITIILSFNIAIIFTIIGIKASVNNTINKQFSKIYKYDSILKIKKTNDVKLIEENLYKNKLIKDSLNINQSIITINKNKVILMIPFNNKKINNFIFLKNQKNKEIRLNDKGVIITKKLSNLLNLKENDNIKITFSNSNEQKLKVINITENYTDNCIYMSYNLYKSLNDEEINFNTLLIKTLNDKKTNKDILQLEVNNYNEIEEYIKVSDIKNKYKKATNTLNYICNMLIITFSLLFLIILYNLTLMNLKNKEISILKSIGFSNIQIIIYYIKHNIILILYPIIGIILGSFYANIIIKNFFTNELIIHFDIKIVSYVLVLISFYIFIFLLSYIKIKKISILNIKKIIE